MVTHRVGTSPAGPIVMSACPSFLVSVCSSLVCGDQGGGAEKLR